MMDAPLLFPFVNISHLTVTSDDMENLWVAA